MKKVNYKKSIYRTIFNLLGWHTKRKIIVIESDDWGSIRMPSKKVYYNLQNAGIKVNQCVFNKYDSLASEDDLSALFEVLSKFKDMNGNPPVITANSVVANPDFTLIRESNFKNYYYELFPETLKKYPRHRNSFLLWKQGIQNKIFYPQFHGREHLNIPMWLDLLRKNDRDFILAFNNGMWGIGPATGKRTKVNIQASFDAVSPIEVDQHKEILKDGLDKFEELFGYRSKSFIANNFIWHPELNKSLHNSGVRYLQGMRYQLIPIKMSNKRRKKFHYTGEKNAHNQRYLVRNCIFEPTQNSTNDSLASCLQDISNAFLWGKPAIITSHRLNYIGFINEKNRIASLEKLEKLISKILIKYPDVEFMTSNQLGLVIENDLKKVN